MESTLSLILKLDFSLSNKMSGQSCQSSTKKDLEVSPFPESMHTISLKTHYDAVSVEWRAQYKLTEKLISYCLGPKSPEAASVHKK